MERTTKGKENEEKRNDNEEKRNDNEEKRNDNEEKRNDNEENENKENENKENENKESKEKESRDNEEKRERFAQSVWIMSLNSTVSFLVSILSILIVFNASFVKIENAPFVEDVAQWGM